MKLVRKLSLAISLGVCVVLGLRVWVRLEEERRDFRADVQRDHDVLGGALALAVLSVWERDGQEPALALVNRVNSERAGVSIRYVEASPTNEPRHRARVPEFIPAARLPPRSNLVMEKGVPTMLTYAPIALPDRQGAAIEVYERLTAEDDVLGRFVNRFVVTTLVLVSFCAVIIFGFGVIFVAKPLRKLIDKAERIGRGDLGGPVLVMQNDEIREVAQAVNHMCDRLRDARELAEAAAEARMRAVTQLRHADRLRTVGELASGIAHQLGTPLNVIRGRGAMIANGEVAEARMRELGAIVVEQADRVGDTIRRLLDFSRRQHPTFTMADINQLVEQSVRLVESLASERAVQLKLSLPEQREVSALDAGQIHQALTNLIVNAVHVSPASEAVEVAVTREGDELRVSVRDRGKGIADDQLQQIFDPFYTTKRAGEGTGLGLSVADGIVREHGGHISVESRPGKGATFTMHLPVRSLDEARASLSQPPA
jgi:two-component system NtrC family sensor kinase